jgi:uncharacterized protein YpmB
LYSFGGKNKMKKEKGTFIPKKNKKIIGKARVDKNIKSSLVFFLVVFLF